MRKIYSRLIPVTALALGLLVLVSLSGDVEAQQYKRQRKVRPVAPVGAKIAPAQQSPVPRRGGAVTVNKAAYMAKAKALMAGHRWDEASRLLFSMTRNSSFEAESGQLKYALAISLYNLRMYQTAAFVFFEVIRQESQQNPHSRFISESLRYLSLSADMLDSDVILRYAIQKVNQQDFPQASRDMLYFRTGEIKMGDMKYAEAAQLFAKVPPNSNFYLKAKYDEAMALAEAKDNNNALRAFDDLMAISGKGITDPNRVNALLGRARVLYQAQKWDESVEGYRAIPRDTEQWHEALFESSWAMLRGAKFRSAISNFQSLHSPYYENFYQPESLLLRAIVYLYICRYDDMDTVLQLFDTIYLPVQRDIRTALETDRTSQSFYKEAANVAANANQIKLKGRGRSGLRIPFLAMRSVIKEGDVAKSMKYLHHLEAETRRINGMPVTWRSSPVGKYASRVVDRRTEATRDLTGKLVRRHLLVIQNDLRDFFEQANFLRFEQISGKKESVKKELAGKTLQHNKVDEHTNRDYYVKNGYEYWPFDGEYWLDEIGNYHYVGVQACE